MGLNPWDKVVILKRTHEAIFSQICAPPQKCGVIGESGKPQKDPENKSYWESQCCSAEKRQDWEVVWKWFSTGKKLLHYQRQHCSLCLLEMGISMEDTMMSWNGKERRAGQKLGKYLMLKKMPLTGVEISSLKVNENRYRNQDRMGSVLGQKNRQSEKNLLFFAWLQALLAHNVDQVMWPSRSTCGSHQWRSTKISGVTTLSKSPKGWNHLIGGAVKSK